jgi:uncharacterized protein YggU (UPF0235/DUF167 family)
MTVLLVKVKPNARQSALTSPETAGEPWLAQLKSPPVDGKANEELVSLVARHFGCARGAREMGKSQRTKSQSDLIPPG